MFSVVDGMLDHSIIGSSPGANGQVGNAHGQRTDKASSMERACTCIIVREFLYWEKPSLHMQMSPR